MCDNHSPKIKKKRFGSALQHGEAHQEDHKSWSRRTFLKTTGLAGGMSMFLGKFPLTAHFASPLAYLLNGANSDRILVLIRLKGGNDGLNTFVPIYDYGTYSNLRPTLAIPQNQLINLSPKFGMNNNMQPLENMWNDGKMKVLHGVGYEDQNLSHFRSSDIWASASDSNVYESSGWLGRFIMDEYPDYLTNPPAMPPAIKIGSTGDVVFQDINQLDLGVSVTDPDQLADIAQTGDLFDVNAVPDCYFGDQLSFLRTVTNATFIYADAISQAYNDSTNNVSYTTSLGNQLSLVARLIKGNLGTRMYMVTLDGFDTHAEQNVFHPQLLDNISQAVSQFYQDLDAGGYGQNVLSMTFSEFGRRIEQNASDGTDHGAAAPIMFFGEGLNGNGFLGSDPDLQDVDNAGNLKHNTDFRQVYASVLENWLCVNGQTVDDILGESFTRIDLGVDCLSTGTTAPAFAKADFEHHARYISPTQIAIHYTLPQDMPVDVTIFDVTGRPVQTIFKGYQSSGTHQVPFYPANGLLASGIYFYRISAGGRVLSKPIRFTR